MWTGKCVTAALLYALTYTVTNKVVGSANSIYLSAKGSQKEVKVHQLGNVRMLAVTYA